MAKWLLVLVLLVTGAPSAAQVVTLYLMEVPPLTINSEERKGIVGDVVLEAMRRAGYDVKLEVVPSNRALAAVAHPSSRNLYIIPLARVAPREDKYTWVAPVIKVNRAFFAFSKPVRSFEEARASYGSIGVSRGTAGLHILRAEGFAEQQIVELNQAQTPPKMLWQHRIDAWYGPVAEGKALLQTPDAPAKVQMSSPLGQTVNYLGCSRACNSAMANRLAAILADMEKDGSARAIREKYGEIE